MSHARTSTARRWNFLSRAVLFLLAAPPGLWAEDVVFKAGVNHVLLDVSVTDVKGQPVPNLRREQFQVSENHSRRDITTFANGDVDISVAVVIDNSRSMRPRQAAVLTGLAALVGGLQKGDEAAMLLFQDRVDVAINFQNHPAWIRWRDALLKERPDGRTSLYDAIRRASGLLESSAHERRVIIVLSDGQDTSSQATLNDAINELRSSNRLLYAIGLFEAGDSDSSSDVLKKLAEPTGGQLILDADGTHLKDSFTAVLKDLRSRYLLGFNSADATSGKAEIRRLSVTILNPPAGRLHILARREYRVAPN